MAACPGFQSWTLKPDSLRVATETREHCPGCRDAAPPVLTEEERGWVQAATSLKDRITADSHMMHAAYIAQLLRIIDRLTTGGTGGSRE